MMTHQRDETNAESRLHRLQAILRDAQDHIDIRYPRDQTLRNLATAANDDCRHTIECLQTTLDRLHDLATHEL